MNWTCNFCDKELLLKNKYTKSGHLAKCKKYKDYKNTYFTKEYLILEYLNNERSALEIAQEHKLESASVIIKLLITYNIKTRNIKESKTELQKSKYKETSLKNYGAEHNFLKKSYSRKKWEKDMFETYGITNIFQRQDIIDQICETKYERGYIIPRKYKTDELEKYYYDVWYNTNISYNKFYYDINVNNVKRSYNTYHLDHKISILYGFLNNIDPKIIGHKCNLEILYYKDNLSKGSKCSLTLDELLNRINEVEQLNLEYERSKN